MARPFPAASRSAAPTWFRTRSLEVAHYQLRERDVAGELARFDKAVATAGAELDALRSEASVPGAPAELSAFVDVHAMILADPR
jgi:phosphotransferase system enzyme I (PtsI)